MDPNTAEYTAQVLAWAVLWGGGALLFRRWSEARAIEQRRRAVDDWRR
jgi:hypothetical protein